MTAHNPSDSFQHRVCVMQSNVCHNADQTKTTSVQTMNRLQEGIKL